MGERVLTLAEIDAIERGCEGVTPGPWKRDKKSVRTRVGLKVANTFADWRLTEESAWRDAYHIARLDPATVKALCALARAALQSDK